MCAILDANVVAEVFGTNRPPAGKGFFDWLDKGDGRLAVGGKLLEELDKSASFKRWRVNAVRYGRVRRVDKDVVNSKTKEIEGACKSDDPHVIALAQVSGSRLLYSNDLALHKDFTDLSLIKKPPGKVYSTLRTSKFTRARRDLLVQAPSCSRRKHKKERR